MPVKNVYLCNSLITGLANSGLGKQALTLFWKMRLVEIEPNDVMMRVYGIRPLEEHYGCMVDLLGRTGMIKEAVDFMDGMPVEPHPGLLGALARACRTHGELELGEEVAKMLFELDPHHGKRHMLAGEYACGCEEVDDMSMVRKTLKERRVAKVGGNSLVELQPVAN